MQPHSASLTAIAFGIIQKVGGNRSLKPEMAREVQRVLLDVIATDFTDKQTGKTASERAIGKTLKLSQPQLNSIRNWTYDPTSKVKPKPPNIGVQALVALADYTHLTIDAILGRELPLPVKQRQEQLDAIIAKAEEMTALLEKESLFHFGPTSKIGKLKKEIQDMAAVARSQKERDERIKRVNQMPKSRRKVG